MNGRKIRVLLDIDNILLGVVNSRDKTGLYWVSYNIVNGLMKETDLSITFISNRFTLDIYQKLCDLEPAFENFDCIINPSAGKFYSKVATYLKVRRIEFRRKKRNSTGLKKIANFALYLFFTVPAKLFEIVGFFLKGKIDCNNFDIYQSFYYKIPNFVLKNGRIGKCLFVHDVFPLVKNDVGENISKVYRKSFEKMFKNLGNNVVFLFNSQCSKKDFFAYFPKYSGNRNLVVSLAANKKQFFRDDTLDTEKAAQILDKYGIPQNAKYILNVGSLNPRKNLLFLVKCFCRFLETHSEISDLYLLLSGPNGWQTEKIFSQIRNSAGQRSKIILSGFLDPEDINMIYNGAFFFVFPSFYEGFGLPLLEAMQCGVPIISSNTSSMPEVYGDAAIAIDPKDEQGLLDAFEKMYFDDKLRNTLVARGLERAKLFDWSLTVRRIMDEYRRILK